MIAGRRIANYLALCLLPLFCIAASGQDKLTRPEAKFGIDTALAAGDVPGYRVLPVPLVGLFSLGPQESSSISPLEAALVNLGYIKIDDHVRKNKNAPNIGTVSLTEKVGAVIREARGAMNEVTYQNGFKCLSDPSIPSFETQCFLSLVEVGHDYQITGITQEGIHARVEIVIPWKLTKLGLDLKAYARLNKDLPDFDGCAASGTGSAVILFQKYDDGWRIIGGSKEEVRRQTSHNPKGGARTNLYCSPA
jgi:hypothetical protein